MTVVNAVVADQTCQSRTDQRVKPESVAVKTTETAPQPSDVGLDLKGRVPTMTVSNLRISGDGQKVKGQMLQMTWATSASVGYPERSDH